MQQRHRITSICVAQALALSSIVGCVDDKKVTVVLRGEADITIHENARDVSQSLPRVIGVPDIIGDVLVENGYTIDDVDSVTVLGGFFGTDGLEGTHDWTVTGTITAQRVDGVVAGPTATVFPYTSQSVEDALGASLPVPFDAPGVALINEAAADYLAGGSPMIEFRADNSSVTPQPSLIDPMVFDWNVRIRFNVFIHVDARVPDPF